jgi:histidinol dehydrogenase
MRLIYTNNKDEYDFLGEIKKRTMETSLSTNEAVIRIINEVREKGDAAVRGFGKQFDGSSPEKFEIPKAEMKQAYERAEVSFKKALNHAKDNITAYHIKQRQQGYEIKKDKGVILGQIVRGLSRVGIYVPGGTAAYPSTVLMNAIPAKIAGVEEIIMVTPPIVEKSEGQEPICKGNPDILAAAYLAGVDRVFLIGGAQAVAALTFGTESIPQVDKIVGPGNIYVASAKRLLFGQVDIDMIAGPSEILVIAEEDANPRYIAADLMSQAEHDIMASAILLTTSEKIAKETLQEIALQKTKLNRNEIIEKSLADYGSVIVCKSMEEMIMLANAIAPEHLELMVKDPLKYLPEIKNAGSVFCGSYTPEPLGDYLSGTNHVLPTAASVAVCKAIEEVTGIYCQIKWVNDIFMGEKKICGILTEAVSNFENGQIEHIVIGIGINYSTNTSDFPEELQKTAGSLFGDMHTPYNDNQLKDLVSNPSISRNRLIAEVINQILDINENLESRDFIPEYKKRSFVLGKEILIIPAGGAQGERNLSEGTTALALDIDQDGGLVVQYRDGSIDTLNSGEISIRTTSY